MSLDDLEQNFEEMECFKMNPNSETLSGRVDVHAKKTESRSTFSKSFVGNYQMSLDDLEQNFEETECFKMNPNSETLIWDV